MARPSNAEITALYENMQQKDAELSEVIQKVTQAQQDIESKQDNITSLESKIKALHKSSQKQHGELSAYHQEVLEDEDEDDTSIKSQLAKTVSEATEELEELQEKLSKMKTLDIEIFGLEKTELNEDGEPETSRIIGLKQKLEDFYRDKTDESDLLFKDIRALLPEATATSLASSYDKSYKVHRNRERAAFGLFFYCILLLLFVAWLVTFEVNIPPFISSRTVSSGKWFDSFLPFLKLLPFVIPITWLAMNQQRTMKNHQRIAEDYLYKKNIMQTYIGFSEQAKEAGEKDNQYFIKLWDMVMNVKSQNPSLTMDKYQKESDHPAQSFMSNVVDGVKPIANKATKEVGKPIPE